MGATRAPTVDFDNEAHRARERVHEDDVRHSGQLRGHVVEASRLALELDEVGGAEGREARDADGPRFEERDTATRHRPERLPEDVSDAAPRGAPVDLQRRDDSPVQLVEFPPFHAPDYACLKRDDGAPRPEQGGVRS